MLAISDQQNLHVLVVIDAFTKYIESYPMKSTLMNDLAKVFYYNYILRHGIPDEIILDNGASFNN